MCKPRYFTLSVGVSLTPPSLMEMLSLLNFLCFDLKIRSLDLSTFNESLLAFNQSDASFRSQFRTVSMDFNLLFA